MYIMEMSDLIDSVLTGKRDLEIGNRNYRHLGSPRKGSANVAFENATSRVDSGVNRYKTSDLLVHSQWVLVFTFWGDTVKFHRRS